jgi:hypothetical protein
MPSKEEVRQWMQQRQVEHKPPPAPAEVRRQLGWHLITGKAPECAR